MDAMVELASPSVRADPYPFLARLRETEPVHYSAASDRYLVSAYADVQSAFRALGDVFRRPVLTDLPPAMRQPATALLFDSVAMRNPPSHTRLRGLVARDFTVGRVDSLRERMTKICHSLLEPLSSTVDLCDVLERFPLYVISSLLGVPLRDSDELGPLIKATLAGLSPTASPSELSSATSGNALLVDYFTALIESRRTVPRDDLISALASSGLTQEEVLGTVWAIWLAGYETSASALALGVLMMLEHPDLPPTPAFVQEVLRYAPPILFAPLPRITSRAVTVGGVEIPPGGNVHFVYAAANRDPAVFRDPNVFNPARPSVAHTTFGGGINRCLGAALATAEMTVLLGMLRDRFPQMALAGEPEFAPVVYLRSCHHLPVSL